MNNIVFVTKQDTNTVLKINIILLLVFICLTVIVYNIYKKLKLY